MKTKIAMIKFILLVVAIFMIVPLASALKFGWDDAVDCTGSWTATNDNFTISNAVNENAACKANGSMDTGNLYAEVIVGEPKGGFSTLGISNDNVSLVASPTTQTGFWAMILITGANNGDKVNGQGSGGTIPYCDSGFPNGGTVGIAINITGQKIWFRDSDGYCDAGSPENDTNPAFSNVDLDGGTFRIMAGTEGVGTPIYTLNTTDFQYPIPTGYTAWGADPVVPDNTPPFFLTDSINDTSIRINEPINVALDSRDGVELASVSLANNLTATLTNISTQTFSTTATNASFNFTNTLVRGHVVGYQFTLVDASGNTNQTDILTYVVQNTPPETPTIIFPTEGLFTPNQPLDINYTFLADPDLDGVRIDCYIDGVLNQSSFTNTTLNASDASYSLSCSTDDGQSSSASNATVSFTIDTINPILTITAPVNNSIHTQNIEVNLTCTNVNLKNMTYIFHNVSNASIQEEVNVTNGGVATISVPITISGLGDQQYSFNVSCTDNASLTTNRFLNLNLDQSNPIIISTDLENQTPQENQNISYNVTCSDNFIGVASILIASNATPPLSNISTLTFPNQATANAEFNHTVVLGNSIAFISTCIDGAGLETQSGFQIYNSSAAPVIVTERQTTQLLENFLTVALAIGIIIALIAGFILQIRSRRSR